MEQPRPGGPGAPGIGQSERPLGRGLEHLSRVFLTQQPPERFTGPGTERPPGRPLPEDGPTAGAVLVHPAAQATREQVVAAVKEFAGALEDGLKVIDGGIPCAPCGEIDLLAVDRTNQLVVIDFETAPTDELLIRGLGHADWMVGNVANLRRMFRGNAINFSLQPRLFLLAPHFSPRVRCAARQVASPEIEWVRYQMVEMAGRTGIFFERRREEWAAPTPALGRPSRPGA
jgi:hypothetical protein